MCSLLFIFGTPKTLLKLLMKKESLRKLEMQAETFSQYITKTEHVQKKDEEGFRVLCCKTYNFEILLSQNRTIEYW